ncbi:DUF4153 domain-containing protein [Pseudopelagicola sp. nBUS_20]|uniref:DUF4153 domain-containing protein n=1 Tax=Pseudopelagicola sp. nBUS_20 TaxID=3395317 RepID=UPI003EBCA9DC
MRASDRRTPVGRVELVFIGGAAGLSIWALLEKAHGVLTNPQLFVGVTSAISGYFVVLLALIGLTTLLRSAFAAAVIALPAALLLFWCSLRFDTLETFVEAGHPIFTWALFLFVGTPFIGVWLENSRETFNYARLFNCTWAIVVRYSASWLFVGLFWVVIFLSDALLQIVGVRMIEKLVEIEPVNFVLSGAVLGLGLSVVFEMREYVSPFLLLRLLRLLMPVMLVVVLVFVSSLVLRRSPELFGELSPAATILAVAIGAISLISVALDRRDVEAVTSVWMRGSAALLAVLLPILACLAAYAIWLRVVQYGWTPSRLLASTVCTFILIYGVCYAGSVFLRGHWMARIRRVNTLLAGGILLVCAAWLSPLLNVESISTNSQVARYLSGAANIKQAALWEMAHEWGRSGHQGLIHLEKLPEGAPVALSEAIAVARKSVDRYRYEEVNEIRSEVSSEKALALHALVRVLPVGLDLNSGVWNALPHYRLEEWLDLCRRDRAPGCVLILDEFDPTKSGKEGILLLPGRGDTYNAMSVRLEGDAFTAGSYINGFGSVGIKRDHVQKILGGSYRIGPSSQKSLWLGDIELRPKN